MPTKSIAELKSMVGQSYRTVEGFEVEAGKVAEFSRAIGDEPRLGQDDAGADRARDDSSLAALTFTRTAYFPRYRPPGVDAIRPFDLGFRDVDRVHGEQEYEYKRPVVIGDVLSADVTLTDVYQCEGNRGGEMTFAVIEITYTDQDDELVLTERQTIIETGESVETSGDKA